MSIATQAQCSDGCGRLVGPKGAKGRCSACNTKRRRESHKADPKRFCEVKGCERPTRDPGTQWCDLHYARVRRAGEPGEADPYYVRGDGGTHSSGYRVVTVDGRRGMEHRFIMEQMLGRFLWPDETVHHKNGDRLDNRPENLELWSKAQPAGQRVEDKIAWAVELLERYGYTVEAP